LRAKRIKSTDELPAAFFDGLIRDIAGYFSGEASASRRCGGRLEGAVVIEQHKVPAQ
jgi:hypothetical protein